MGVALYAGTWARSSTLVGFGLDSVLEVLSAAIVLWRLYREVAGGGAFGAGEGRAAALVAVILIALGAYLSSCSPRSTSPMARHRTRVDLASPWSWCRAS